MPVEFPEPPQAPREPGPVLAFGHLGPARVEKGFQEIVQAFAGDRSGLARPVRLALQVTGVEAPGLHARLAEALPSDVLIPGDLSEARYWELLSACDAALLPYDPAAYGIRSSRILVEAVGLGLPVLVTRGTWLDGELERLGGAGLRVGFEADDIRQGVARLAEEMPVLRAKAAEAAPACRSRHSPRAFVDAVLDAAGLGPQK
jgi:glycosyltransferase involved in cell wall biosynthesis